MQLLGPSLSPIVSRFSPFELLSVSKSETNFCARNFGSNEGVMDTVDEYLGDQEEGFYFEGISKLVQHWRKCIEAKGDYIEK